MSVNDVIGKKTTGKPSKWPCPLLRHEMAAWLGTTLPDTMLQVNTWLLCWEIRGFPPVKLMQIWNPSYWCLVSQFVVALSLEVCWKYLGPFSYSSESPCSGHRVIHEKVLCDFPVFYFPTTFYSILSCCFLPAHSNNHYTQSYMFSFNCPATILMSHVVIQNTQSWAHWSMFVTEKK